MTETTYQQDCPFSGQHFSSALCRAKSYSLMANKYDILATGKYSESMTFNAVIA